MSASPPSIPRQNVVGATKRAIAGPQQAANFSTRAPPSCAEVVSAGNLSRLRRVDIDSAPLARSTSKPPSGGLFFGHDAEVAGSIPSEGSMYLRIRHATTYRYAGPVQFGPHRLMLRPRDSFDLRVVDTALTISPKARLRWMHDAYGNSVAIANFTRSRRHARHRQRTGDPALRLGHAAHRDRARRRDHRRGLLRGRARRAAALSRSRRRPIPIRCSIAGSPISGRGSARAAAICCAISPMRSMRGLSYALRYDEGTQHPADTIRPGLGILSRLCLAVHRAGPAHGLRRPLRHRLHP